MRDIIRDDLKRIFGLKRFWIMCALLFAGFIAWSINTKITFWNDLMYVVKVQKYMLYFFNFGTLVTVLLSQHRKKFTKNNIAFAGDHGGSRVKVALGKWIMGIGLIFVFYAALAILVLFMGLILGAHNSGDQIGVMMLSILMSSISTMGSYALCLMFQFLTAFPALSLVLASITVEILPILADRWGFAMIPETMAAYNLLMYGQTRAAFSGFLLGMPRFGFILLFLIYTAIGVLLSMLIFKLKREKKPRKKKGQDAAEEEIGQDVCASAEVN